MSDFFLRNSLYMGAFIFIKWITGTELTAKTPEHMVSSWYLLL